MAGETTTAESEQGPVPRPAAVDLKQEFAETGLEDVLRQLEGSWSAWPR